MIPEDRAARAADVEGQLDRDGVTIAYRVYGDQGPTVVLMPTWSIVPSRVWKAQVPYLARHFRVVTFDGRGSGRSDAPEGAAAYADEEYVADTLAVLEATGTADCVLVAFSCGAPWALQIALDQPERIHGVVCIGPATGLIPADRRTHPMGVERAPRDDRRVGQLQPPSLVGGRIRELPAVLLREDVLRTALHQADRGRRRLGPADRTGTSGRHRGRPAGLPIPCCSAASCPGVGARCWSCTATRTTSGRTTRVYGSPRLTGGSLVTISGGGHAPQNRDPVKVNHLIKDFVDQVAPRPVRRTWVRALNRPRRALYLSSPIGLGHARRDVAIAAELRKLQPDLQIDWLAQHPVTRVLADAGETVHPASDWLCNESAHIEFEADEHDLHAFQAIRRMDEILVNELPGLRRRRRGRPTTTW